jgi:hypothetical protein
VFRRIREWLSPVDALRPADLIFVLAGRQNRKEYGLELFRRKLAPRILLSVGRFEIRRFSKMTLPVPLDLLSMASTIPPPQRHYFVEFSGEMFHVKHLRPGRFGTLAEVSALADWLKGEREVASVLIVSSPAHLRRVRLCCRMLLPKTVEVRLAAVPAKLAASSAGPWVEKESAGAVLGELLKLAVYRVLLRRSLH